MVNIAPAKQSLPPFTHKFNIGIYIQWRVQGGGGGVWGSGSLSAPLA